MIGAALGSLLARFAVPLAAVAGLTLATGAASLWDRFVDDPAVAAAARRGYVLESEKTAAEAELAEVRRQLAAATAARNRFAVGLAQANAAAQAHAEKLESEIADYEKKLDAAGRKCGLDRADIEWLRQP